MIKHLWKIVFAATMFTSGSALSEDIADPTKDTLAAHNAKNAILNNYSKKQRYSVMNYCMKFEQIPSQLTGALIKEFESKNISPEAYLMAPLCQPDGYSDAVSSPMIHAVADDPNKREETLNNIWLYYSKKRKQPEIFTELLNAKNTMGETFLDYLASRVDRDHYNVVNQYFSIAYIVKFSCEHGAVYSTTIKKFDISVPTDLSYPPNCIAALRSRLK